MPPNRNGRIRIKRTWAETGKVGRRLELDFIVNGTRWTPVVWDDEEDPDWHKSAGLEDIPWHADMPPLGAFAVLMEQAKIRIGHEPIAWVHSMPDGSIWAHQKTWQPEGEGWTITRYTPDDPVIVPIEL